MTRWSVLQTRERFRKSPIYDSQRASESDLALLVGLLHARELLTVHGISSFKECVDGWVQEQQEDDDAKKNKNGSGARSGARLSWSKRKMLQSTAFRELHQALDATTTGSTGSSSSSSNAKLIKLREVLEEHFCRHAGGGSSTRAIVFTQYRSSVSEIVA
ncbi:MAG: hypothetical protein JW759_01180 [Candidatus Coatesbacteria bacterium]|nr:hypothetical protein [Candidatus Coatesbacteria bacterium]